VALGAGVALGRGVAVALGRGVAVARGRGVGGAVGTGGGMIVGRGGGVGVTIGVGAAGGAGVGTGVALGRGVAVGRGRGLRFLVLIVLRGFFRFTFLRGVGVTFGLRFPARVGEAEGVFRFIDSSAEAGSTPHMPRRSKARIRR